MADADRASDAQPDEWSSDQPYSIAGLQRPLVLACSREAKRLPIPWGVKARWMKKLHTTAFPFHGTLLFLLLTMLPNLERLCFGNARLINYPLLRDMLGINWGYDHEWNQERMDVVSHWNSSSLSCTLSLLGAKLTVLELPPDCRFPTTNKLYRSGFSSIPVPFPNLRWLSIILGVTRKLSSRLCLKHKKQK
jgi:hypothetical protein